MGVITFARVDSRLIHGQIVAKWAKSSGANHIYIIDDVTNQDEFMKDILMSSGKRYGFKVKVFSMAEAIATWQATEFGKDKVFALFKETAMAIQCIDQGLPISILNIGGTPKKAGRETYINNVALSQSELTDLRRIAKDKKIEIYAQTVPDEQRKTIS